MHSELFRSVIQRLYQHKNHLTLKTLHMFINQQTKLNTFQQNISAISLIASHLLFICRKDPTFTEPPYILPSIKEPNPNLVLVLNCRAPLLYPVLWESTSCLETVTVILFNSISGCPLIVLIVYIISEINLTQ